MNTTANVASLLASTAATIDRLMEHGFCMTESTSLLRQGANKPGRRPALRRRITQAKIASLPLIGELAVLCAQLEQSGRTEAVAKAARELSSWCCVVIAELDTANVQRLTEQHRWIEIWFLETRRAIACWQDAHSEESCEARNAKRAALCRSL